MTTNRLRRLALQERPDRYKTNDLFIEKKTKRIQLVLQPSLYEKARSRASSIGVSLNEYVHILLEDDLKHRNEHVVSESDFEWACENAHNFVVDQNDTAIELEQAYAEIEMLHKKLEIMERDRKHLMALIKRN